jgi:DNA-binding GntR family transcriptional regulator
VTTVRDLLATPPDLLWAAPPHETVSAMAYRLLRDAILQGKIPLGGRINELELATAWRISRTPIRDALRRLEAEGLVQAVPRRGVVVPALNPIEVEELYELREVLEGRAARRAAERPTPELHGRINQLIKAFGAALKQGDVNQMVTIDLDLHAALAAASGSTRLQHAIQQVAGQAYAFRTRTFQVKGRAAKSLREMAKVVAAVRARDGARAERAMQEHIASVRAELSSVFEALDS